MTRHGTYTATVDRIVEGQAVLLVEDDGEVVDERHLSADELPADAGEGAVCDVTFEDDAIADVVYRPADTVDRRERMREKFDRLSKRLGDEGPKADEGPKPDEGSESDEGPESDGSAEDGASPGDGTDRDIREDDR